MKRIFVAILALLYLSTSIGTTLQLHYCMGKLVEWKLRHNNNSMCSRCGMEKKSGSTKGCCKDEYTQIKIDKDQKLSERHTQLNQIITERAPINFSDHLSPFQFSLSEKFSKINAPPRSRNTHLDIFNCVFRI